jgi:hypothetical protein
LLTLLTGVLSVRPFPLGVEPLNPEYPTLAVTLDAQFVGVLIEKRIVEKYFSGVAAILPESRDAFAFRCRREGPPGLAGAGPGRRLHRRQILGAALPMRRYALD